MISRVRAAGRLAGRLAGRPAGRPSGRPAGQPASGLTVWLASSSPKMNCLLQMQQFFTKPASTQFKYKELSPPRDVPCSSASHQQSGSPLKETGVWKQRPCGLSYYVREMAQKNRWRLITGAFYTFSCVDDESGHIPRISNKLMTNFMMFSICFQTCS